jgi:hypothetical protein
VPDGIPTVEEIISAFVEPLCLGAVRSLAMIGSASYITAIRNASATSIAASGGTGWARSHPFVTTRSDLPLLGTLAFGFGTLLADVAAAAG